MSTSEKPRKPRVIRVGVREKADTRESMGGTPPQPLTVRQALAQLFGRTPRP